MSNLKWRLALIGVLILGSIWALFPRNERVRSRRADGTFYDTTTYRVPLRKGLDQSGGMHLALEVDDSKGVVADKSEAIDRALKVVRTRIEGLGVSETVIQKAGNDRIIVDIPGIDDRERAIKMAQDQAFLEFQITDKTNAFEKVLPRLDALAREKGFGPSTTAAGAATPNANAGLNGLLTTGKDTGAKAATAVKGDSAKTDSTALATGGPISKLIMAGQMPGQFLFDRTNYDALKNFIESPDVQAALPPGKVIRFGNDSTVVADKTYRFLYMLDERPIITGEYLTEAKPNTNPIEGTIVEFTLNNEGGRRFQRETAKHVRDYMAIVLDKVVMGGPPVINSAIGTRGQIAMGQGRDLQAAQDLALVLKAGALPVPLRVAEVRNIGPILGADSIRHGMLAGGIAIVVIVGIMLGYYRFSGMLAVGGLALYVLYTRARGIHSLDRYRRRRQRADLRAHPRGAGPRKDRPHRDRRGLPSCDERDHRLERHDDPHRDGPLSVRHRSGEGICRHADRRYRRVHDHVDLRREDVLPPVAQPLARRPDAEHLGASCCASCTEPTTTSSRPGASPLA